jgi:hypothetical protein
MIYVTRHGLFVDHSKRSRGAAKWREPEVFRYILCLLLFAYVSPAASNQLTVPAGTQVYLEPGQLITSKRGENNVGEIIRASVWRNVVVNGHVVIKAGAPAVGRITDIKRRNIAGKKGQIKIAAVSARGVDGQDILLDGGYHEKGKSRVALSVTLFLLVAWPLIFIPGKNAEMGPGNIFDGEVQEDTLVDVTGSRPVLKLAADDGAEFQADVIYDAIDPEEKLTMLPLELKQCGATISDPKVVSVNGELIEESIDIEILELDQGEDCGTAKAQLKFKTLLKQFQLGINRFEVESNGETAEVIFQAEL